MMETQWLFTILFTMSSMNTAKKYGANYRLVSLLIAVWRSRRIYLNLAEVLNECTKTSTEQKISCLTTSGIKHDGLFCQMPYEDETYINLLRVLCYRNEQYHPDIVCNMITTYFFKAKRTRVSVVAVLKYIGKRRPALWRIWMTSYV